MYVHFLIGGGVDLGGRGNMCVGTQRSRGRETHRWDVIYKRRINFKNILYHLKKKIKKNLKNIENIRTQLLAKDGKQFLKCP